MDINNEKELLLDTAIKEFYENKQQAERYKKLTDTFNTDIKELLTELDTTEFETSNGLIAKMTIQHRESFDEPKLIEKLKQLDLAEAINTVEVINYDKIEDLIYNGKLNASLLAEFKEVKEIKTLKVTQRKSK